MRILPSNSYQSQRGFSLVEVTLTLAIVSVSLLPILGMLGSGVGVQRESEDRFVAADISQALVSQLRLVGSELITITASQADGELPEVVSFGNPVAEDELSVVVSCDRAGGILAAHGIDVYASGLSASSSEALYLVKIEITRPDGTGQKYSRGYSAGAFSSADFRKITISVEQPAFVGEENRTKRLFQTFKSFSLR